MKKIVTLVLAIVMIAAVMLTGCSGGTTADGTEQVTLNFLNWGDYIEPTVIEQFEKANPDIKINMTTVPSNEEMYAIASTEGCEIDVMVPSEYMVEQFMAEDLLAEIDKSKLSNFKNVEEFSKTRTFDPDSQYSVPYTWGTLGILYNTTMVSDPRPSFDMLWDEKYSGQIYMYDSIRDAFAAALGYRGYDINTRSEEEIAEAGQALIDQRPLVQAYGTDDLRDSMIAGSGAMALIYSGDATYCIEQNEDLAFVVPEGTNFFVDNFVILKSSDQQEAAHRFIDFLMEPEIAKLNAEYIGYSTPNEPALEIISPDYLQYNSFNPSDEEIARATYFRDLGDFISVYNDQWMKVKTS